MYCAVLLLAVAIEWLSRAERVPLRAPGLDAVLAASRRIGELRVPLCAIALPAAFAAQTAVIAHAAVHGLTPPGWPLGLPLPVVFRARSADSALMLLLALSECGFLWVLHDALSAGGRPACGRGDGRSETDLRRHRTVLATAAAVLIALAVTAPAVTAGDLYAYAGYGMLGVSAAYAPPHHPFAPPYAAINAYWGTPIVAAPYGPLWLALNAAVTAVAHTLPGKLLALRLAGAATLIALLPALWRLGVPPATLAVIALNPFLAREFVADGHNDLAPVVVTVVAIGVARRSPAAAVILAVAAGLMKLPFAMIGALVFADPALPARRRWLCVAASVTGALAGSLLFGGVPYLHALGAHTHENEEGQLVRLGHATLACTVAAAIVALLRSGRWLGNLRFAFAALGAKLLPWYVIWGLPYAVVRERAALPGYFIALPATTWLIEHRFFRPGPLDAAVALVIAVLAIRLVVDLHAARGETATTAA